MNLKKKIIIVSGGSGLLGREIINKINFYEGLPINFDLKENLTNKKNHLFVNLREDKSIDFGIEKVLNKYGRIDGLVNCAYPRTKDWGKVLFEKENSESFNENIQIQLTQVFVLTQKILKTMQKQKSGSIINISSIYGIVGPDFSIYEKSNINPPTVAYSAIKGGLINFNRYIASYFGKYNIRSNCISPGGIFDNQSDLFVKKYSSNVPMNRMGNPDDISPLTCFLLSDSSKYLTGQNIAVDGGWTAI
tara:strand:+ start:1548 stop:2291 length:744 start_codon:yes stop_codon:yes gene_type:complete